MGLLKEFKEFAVKGNVIDMAVGIVIGVAFNKIVTSLVNDIIMPPIGMLLKGVPFKDMKYVIKAAVTEGDKVISPEVAVLYGQFANVVIEFVIVAFTVFMVVKFMNNLIKKREVIKA